MSRVKDEPNDSTPALLGDASHTCFFCSHFSLDTGSPGYSEWTPGDEFSMECFKGVWRYGRRQGDDAEGFRHLILTGLTCPHFTPEVKR